MFHVYILKSIKDKNKTYVGLTFKDPYKRLEEHNNGVSQSTKHYKPWELIYYENFYCKLCADKREVFLKSGIGYRFRRIILENYKKINAKSALQTRV